MARRGECIEARVNGRAIDTTWCNAAIQLNAHEESVVTVCVHGTERLAINGHNANAVLTGAFGNELFRPCAEAINRLVNDEGHLVAAFSRERAHDAAECKGVVPRRFWVAALRHCCAPRCEKRIKVNAKQRRWHEANEAECRVSSANIGGIQEEATRVDHLRDSVNARRWVTNSRKICRVILGRARCGKLLLVELMRVRCERECLGRGARLAREQVVAALWAKASNGTAHRLRIGGVADACLPPVGDLGECAREYFGGER